MPNINFSVNVANDGKSILLSDMSTSLSTNEFYIGNILIETALDGLWKDKITVNITADKLIYPDLESNPNHYYNNGIVIQINASDIFGEDASYVYDNIYTVSLGLYDTLTTSEEPYVVSTDTLSFLSRWFVNNYTLSYNISTREYDIEKYIVYYHGLIARLDSATLSGDSTNIDLILKTFKKLIDIYGLPE